MEAGEKPREIHPEQGYYNDRYARNRPDTVDTPILLAKHVAKTQVSGVDFCDT